MPYRPLKRTVLAFLIPTKRSRQAEGEPNATSQQSDTNAEEGKVNRRLRHPPSTSSRHYQHSREDEHRTFEQLVWVRSFWLSLLTTGAAIFTAMFAYATWVQIKSQAEAAWEQARIANRTLTDTTRARLKLTGITEAHVSRSKGLDVAWFHFKPAYKNFGPSPAESVAFDTHIFVVGAGPSPQQVCRTGSGRAMYEPSSEIIFPQDEGSESWSFQVPIQELKDEARRVLAVQPSGPIYFGCHKLPALSIWNR